MSDLDYIFERAEPLQLGNAVLSPDGTYRYLLTRSWTPNIGIGSLSFVMLNPSTADADLDDPTIRRCKSFAAREGYAALSVANLFAYRATKPVDLPGEPALAIGPHGDGWLTEIFDHARDNGQPVVAAWGAGAPQWRVDEVLELAWGVDLVALGVTKGGHPRHPLYVRSDAPLVGWPS